MPAAVPATQRPAYIYLAYVSKGGLENPAYWKVGRTKNLEERMRQLSNDGRGRAEALHWIVCNAKSAPKIEERIHSRLKEYLALGNEWYREGSFVLDQILDAFESES